MTSFCERYFGGIEVRPGVRAVVAQLGKFVHVESVETLRQSGHGSGDLELGRGVLLLERDHSADAVVAGDGDDDV
jgi:hypothetical protein